MDKCKYVNLIQIWCISFCSALFLLLLCVCVGGGIVWGFVCVCIFVCTCMYPCLFVCVFFVCVYVCWFVGEFVFVCVWVYLYLFVWVYLFVCVYLCVCLWVNVCGMCFLLLLLHFQSYVTCAVGMRMVGVVLIPNAVLSPVTSLGSGRIGRGIYQFSTGQ